MLQSAVSKVYLIITWYFLTLYIFIVYLSNYFIYIILFFIVFVKQYYIIMKAFIIQNINVHFTYCALF